MKLNYGLILFFLICCPMVGDAVSIDCNEGYKALVAKETVLEIQTQSQWYSSHDPSAEAFGPKQTQSGSEIFGYYLTTDAGYAQTYSKDRSVCSVDVSRAKLKAVTFNWGMTLDAAKVKELREEGYDGVYFQGMRGPEIALINQGAATSKGRSTPVPEGFKSLIDARRPISAAGVEAFKVTLPPGYVRQGDRFIFQDQKSTSPGILPPLVE